MTPGISVEMTAFIIAVIEKGRRVAVMRRKGRRLATSSWPNSSIAVAHGSGNLPFSPLELIPNRALALRLRQWVAEQTGVELSYAKQQSTFGN